MTLKIVNVDPDDWIRAPIVAKMFMKDYPDRMGIYHGVVYSKEGYNPLFVYRTKTMIIVRGST